MSMRPDAEFDVVVIGGGPAGACCAGTLAAAGARVLLIEGKRFPREHIGESLLAMSMPYLRAMGAEEQIAGSGFVRKPGAVFVWGGSGGNIHLGMPHPGYAYQVDRARFDELLLARARHAGAVVRHEIWVRDVLRGGDGRVRGVRLVEGTASSDVTARFVVDASGLFQFLPRYFRLPVALEGRRRAAVSAYFDGAARLPEPHDGDIITEATQNGWLWFIPLSETRTSVGLVTDDACLGGKPADAFNREILASRLIRNLAVGAALIRPPRLLRYTNHLVEAPLWGDGYLLAGDSAMFVDPLFSTGVHGALLSGSYAAAGLSAVLEGRVSQTEAASWYDREVRAHYHRVNETVRVLYGVHPGIGEFWRQRTINGISDSDAEVTVRRLGAVGARFFAQVSDDGTIRLPRPLAAKISECRTDYRASRCLPADVPALAPEIRRDTGWAWSKGRLERSVALYHRRSRTKPVSYPATGNTGRIVLEIDGKRPLTDIAGSLSLSTREYDRARLLVGTLAAAGALTLHDGSRQADPEGSMT